MTASAITVANVDGAVLVRRGVWWKTVAHDGMAEIEAYVVAGSSQ